MSAAPVRQVVHGEPSLRLKARKVKCAVTLRGGHLAPAEFRCGDRWVSPFSLAPWKPSECERGTEPILQVLRGDFFCFPFGGQKDGSIHGEPANNRWKPVRSTSHELVMTMPLRQHARGKITKIVRLSDSDAAIYQSHVIEGVRGAYNFGYHAILQFPTKPAAAQIRTSAFVFGGVLPPPYGNPEAGEYSALQAGAVFDDLGRVPLAGGGTTSLKEYPARNGYEDIAMVSHATGDFAWTSVTMDGYVWMSLKDPRTLASTLFWITNGGRHFPPWNGRHRFRMGIEEVTSAFCFGLEDSRRRRGMPEGVPSTLTFHPKKPTAINQIHVVHPVPKNFGGVKKVQRAAGSVLVTGESGRTVTIPVYWRFLHGL
jgi:hypothetical protein